MRKQTAGYTLTEMSVVLVIVGLIISGVLKGQTLIDEAKIRATIAEVSVHKVSIASFYAKYDAYPGDFSTASTYWSAVSNGDGNGAIEFYNTSVYEGFRAWQHLMAARMTNGEYAGTATTSAPTIGTDIPPSKLNGGGFLLDNAVFGLTGSNVLILGKPAATAATPTVVSALLTPRQAMDIDAKMDDGAPLAGSVRGDDNGNTGSGSGCYTGSVYDIATTTIACVLGVKLSDL